MYFFYNIINHSSGYNSFTLLVQLVQKARDNGLSISICVENMGFVEDFSTRFWNMNNTIIHGIITDGFLEMQPVILDVALHKKNIAIVYENAKYEQDINKRFDFQKVIFIGKHKQPGIDGKYWVYKDKWQEVDAVEYFA